MSVASEDSDGSALAGNDEPDSRHASNGEDQTGWANLHLPSLRISGFFGIGELDISRLGKVTLLVGKNSTGKSTVLDAVEVFASRGRPQVIEHLLYRRNELYGVPDDRPGPGTRDRETEMRPSWRSMFYGRQPDFGSQIIISPNNATRDLQIELIYHFKRFLPLGSSVEQPDDFDQLPHLGAKFGSFAEIWPVDPASIWAGDEHIPDMSMPHRMRRRATNGNRSEADPVRTARVGPDVVNDAESTVLWDAITLDQPARETVLDALRIPLGYSISHIAAIDGRAYSPYLATRTQRRLFASDPGEAGGVSLRGLGDGVLRFFQAAASICGSRDGIVLIDEAENGVHHSVMEKYWQLIFHLARDRNAQVIATTHSWDCVQGFAAAAIEDEEAEGVLVRIEKRGSEHRAIEYSEDDLKVVARHQVEVR